MTLQLTNQPCALHTVRIKIAKGNTWCNQKYMRECLKVYLILRYYYTSRLLLHIISLKSNSLLFELWPTRVRIISPD